MLCTHNGAAKLQPTLQHLAGLDKPAGCKAEIILVNNASTDNTEQLSKDTWCELGQPFSLRVINEPRAGKGYAIETGYDAAQYEYIVTADDDNWLRSDYLLNALQLIEAYPDVGIFQAGNEAVFESEPPEWLKSLVLEHYMVIGSPIEKPGYFNKNYYGVWGAGMIIKNADWEFLRKLGFAALTSKIPGKAAGEDVELALGLLLLGRKIYYSDCLHYKHFMPAARLNWKVMEKGFATFGYTDYYFFLYKMIFEAFEKKYTLTPFKLKTAFYKQFLRQLKSRGLRNNINYLIKNDVTMNRLKLRQYYSALYWFNRLSGTAMRDINFIQSWILPLLKKNPNGFKI